MTTCFDGRKFAAEKEESLKKEIAYLKKRGITPKLVSIIVGEDQGSVLYQNLKKKAAERVGAELEIVSLSSSLSPREIQELIEKLNDDKNIHGIMIQLPLPKNFSEKDRDTLIHTIAKEKDVDGLRGDSPFVHPTAKAVIEVLSFASTIVRLPFRFSPCKVCIVGATGMVGRPLVRELRNVNFDESLKFACKLSRKDNKNRHSSLRRDEPRHSGVVQNLKYEVLEADSKISNLSQLTRSADVLIGCSGVPGIIKENMVKEGSVLIDVGAPVGDVAKEAYKKAGFVSPVPGGVGPVGIICLMENLIDSLII